jgi:hypothetical protein
VRRFGGVPVAYGHGPLDRVREAAPEGIAAALDTVGTDEAVDVSLALAPRERIVTIAARARASADGFRAIGGADPDSAAFRDQVRPRLIRLAADGDLVVPGRPDVPVRRGPGRAGAAPLRPPRRQARSDPLTLTSTDTTERNAGMLRSRSSHRLVDLATGWSSLSPWSSLPLPRSSPAKLLGFAKATPLSRGIAT